MNAIESMLATLTTPIAKRKGITISAEDCKVWAEEIDKIWDATVQRLKIAENKVYEFEHGLRKLGK